jgi:hypothetical protein
MVGFIQSYFGGAGLEHGIYSEIIAAGIDGVRHCLVFPTYEDAGGKALFEVESVLDQLAILSDAWRR